MSKTASSRTTSAATNLRTRRATLNQIRKQIIIQYHCLSDQALNDRIRPDGRMIGTGEPPNELTKGVSLLSEAINCINRELGRKEDT